MIQAALASGMEPIAVYLDLLGPALRSIGDRWARGQLSVADEHQASTVAGRLIGRLGPLFARRGRKPGAVLVGSVAGETHALPSAILADILRGAGFEVIDLGANTPPVSFSQLPAGRTGSSGAVASGVLIGATVAGLDEPPRTPSPLSGRRRPTCPPRWAVRRRPGRGWSAWAADRWSGSEPRPP